MNADVDEKDSIMLCSANSKSSSSTTTEDNNIVMAIIQGLFAAIELDFINTILEFFGSSLDNLAEKSFEAVKQTSLLLITTFNTVIFYLKNTFSLDFFSSFDLIDPKGIGKGFGGFISIFSFLLNVDSAGSGAFTKTEDNIMNTVKLVIDIVSLFMGPVAGVLVPLLSDIVIDVTSLRFKGIIFMY